MIEENEMLYEEDEEEDYDAFCELDTILEFWEEDVPEFFEERLVNVLSEIKNDQSVAEIMDDYSFMLGDEIKEWFTPFLNKELRKRKIKKLNNNNKK